MIEWGWGEAGPGSKMASSTCHRRDASGRERWATRVASLGHMVSAALLDRRVLILAPPPRRSSTRAIRRRPSILRAEGRPMALTSAFARCNRLILLGAAALALASVLIAGLLLPLALWEHDEVISGHQPIAVLFGTQAAGAARLLAAILSAYVVFGVAALLARGSAGRRACWLVLAGTVLLALVLLPMHPAGSQDIYHNIADARTFWIHGANPAITPPDAHLDDPFLPYVSVWRDYPSAYGPLWYAIAGVGLPFTEADLWPNVIAQKLLSAGFLVITTVLVMATAGRIQPHTAPLAGVLVGWNPLLLFETAGNAHNDIVMVAFAVAAIYALVRGWWPAVFPLLALAVSAKYILVLLGPLLVMWMLRRREVSLRQTSLSLILGAAVALACYGPFLVGGAIEESLARQSERVLASTGAALTSMLMTERGLDSKQAKTVMKLAMVAVFLVGYAVALWRIPRDPPASALIVAGTWATFLFLVTVAWWFWPWYLIGLVPLAALAPRRPEALLASVFSLTATLMYVTYMWQVFDPDWHGTQRETAATIFVIPLLLALVLLLRPLWRALRRALGGVVA